MRITNKSVFIPFQRNLQNVQERKFKEEVRMSTGNDIVNIADQPNKLVDVKQLSSKISENAKYIGVIEQAKDEMLSVEGYLEQISDNIRLIRQQGIDATQTGNTESTYGIANYVRGLLDDILSSANGDFNGKYLFSGTKTNANSIDPDNPTPQTEPFKLIQGDITDNNPSGLRVEFNGNLKARYINKDRHSQEQINITANEVFGDNGEDFFNTIIDLYNLLAYDSEGNKRQQEDVWTKADTGKLDILQQQLDKIDKQINHATSKNGTRFARLEAIRNQLVQENTRLNEFKSLKNDTDYAKTAINLKQEETALVYSLQIGAQIMQNSLFDFLR
jgi:flagellar hook-associated protein 3 FlgL